MKKTGKKTIHPYFIRLGTRVKHFRKKRGLSLEALGSEIGLDASNMQKIELGQNLTMSTLLKLCICLKITPVKLLDKVRFNLDEDDLDQLTTPRIVRKKKKKSKK